MKKEERGEKRSSSVAQPLGIKRKGAEVEEIEEQPFPDCQWDGKGRTRRRDQEEENQGEGRSTSG